MAGKDYEVRFKGDTTQLTTSLKAVSKSTQIMGRNVSNSTRNAALGIAAMGAASIKLGVDAVKAAAADQQAQLKLAKTLQNVTGATDQAIAATEEFITAQQFATGVSDSTLRPALENLVRATGDVTKAQELLKLGLDVSAGSGRDLESISLALARAQGGQFTSLQRLGIIIPENIKKSKDFAKVQEYLNELFGGQAAVAAGTYEGKLAILRERLGEVQESVGEALLPILTTFVDFITTTIMPGLEVFINALTGKQSLSSSFTGAQEKAFVFGNVVRAVIETIVNYQRFIVGFGAALAAMFVVAKVSAAAGAIVTIIGGIVKALQTLRTVGVLATIATAFATGGVSALAGAAGAATAVAAVGIAFAGINAVMNNYRENVESLPKIDIEPPDTGASAFQDIVLPTATTTGGGGGGGSSANASAAMAKIVATASKAATKALEGMNTALSAARDRLQAARDAYAEYKHSVKDAIVSQFDFSSALGVFKDRQNTAKDAAKRLTDAQEEYNEALKSKDVQRTSDALKELTAAQKDNASATKNNKTFMQTLREQANQAVNFARKVRTLISMGLSQAGIDQVLAAGAEAGTAIANELIAGGSTAIAQTNALLNSVQNAATTLGTSAANSFFQAGITQGQAMVNGIIQAVQAAGFIIKGGTIVLPANLQKALDAGKLTPTQVTELNAILKGVPKLAEGGIVNKPTLALIGEAGPEAVVPLSKMGGSRTNTYNITVNAGMGTNGGQVGREIVDAIKKFERTSGPVFASA